MTPTVILEAYGRLPSSNMIEAERERERREREEGPRTGKMVVGLLHVTFDALSELMNWSSTSPSPSRNSLWNMYEAGLTGHGADTAMIGWLYVGLANPTNLGATGNSAILETVPERAGSAGWAMIAKPPHYDEATVQLSTALPPLVQCFDDALHRIGAVEVSGFQVTCYEDRGKHRDRPASHLVPGATWFNIPGLVEVDALISFDQGFLGDHPPAELVDNIRRRYTGAFSFGQVVSISEQHKVRVPSNTPLPDIPIDPSDLGVSVSLPEWTPSAVGWTLATVVNAARGIAPDAENFSVRIARVE